MDEKTLPEQLENKDTERLASYKTYLDFYNGTQWLTQSRKERQLTFNYARVSIDKVTSYLMSGLDFAVEAVEDSPEAEDAARRAEEALYTVYQYNNCEALDFETEVDTAILGDGCYKVTWDAQENRVRITAPDVQGLWAWWRADDPSRVYRVASRYVMPADQVHASYGITPAGKEAAIVEDWTDGEYGVWADSQQVHSGPNPYGFIPFVIFPDRTLASP